MTSAPRNLVFHEGSAAAVDSLRARLASAGFDAASARTFVQAARLLAAGRTDVLVLYIHEIDWTLSTMLAEVRRANPTLPIIAIASKASDDLFRFLARLSVTSVLPAHGSWRATIDAIRKALAAGAHHGEHGPNSVQGS
jgi:DNA-binding NtrC family response regulator